MADWMTAPGLLPWRIVRMPKVMGASCSGDIREESTENPDQRDLTFIVRAKSAGRKIAWRGLRLRHGVIYFRVRLTARDEDEQGTQDCGGGQRECGSDDV